MSRFFPTSLKARLGAGAAVLGGMTLLLAAALWLGMAQVSQRLDAGLAAERRMDQYAALSTQVSTFIVVAAEVIQTAQSPQTRVDRTDSTAQMIERSFGILRAGLDVEVAEARGLDARSRRASQSLLIARMEALFAGLRGALTSELTNVQSLRGHLDRFASGFEPLLAQAVNEEKRLRTEILSGIDALRGWLVTAAAVMAVLAVVLVAGAYLGLVRPLVRRLDLLGDASRRIGAEDFAVTLPEGRDEIGRLQAQTNRMAATLASRADEVARDRAHLNEIIAERTRALEAANQRLERTDEDRRRFFADISHELRTPLTVILMEAQLGAKGGDFATIESRARRLSRRIDDLLRVARSETGQLALDPAPVSLPALLREAEAETAAELSSAGMELTREAEDATVMADANWLRQVVVGLIRNAIRHARDGGTLHLGVRAVGEMGEITVTDAGPGIPPGDQTRVFDRFAQGQPGSQGFGIGLALARWVVDQQGGTITVQSPADDGRGTRLVVRLPLLAG